MIPIFWGGRFYLIPEEEIILFISAVNLGAEPRANRHGMLYLRESDWDVDMRGRPDLPTKFSALLFAEPRHGEITELKSGQEFRTNLGTADQVVREMILIVITETPPTL